MIHSPNLNREIWNRLRHQLSPRKKIAMVPDLHLEGGGGNSIAMYDYDEGLAAIKLKVTAACARAAISIALVYARDSRHQDIPCNRRPGKNISRDRACYVNLTGSIRRRSCITLSSFSAIPLRAERTKSWMKSEHIIDVSST